QSPSRTHLYLSSATGEMTRAEPSGAGNSRSGSFAWSAWILLASLALCSNILEQSAGRPSPSPTNLLVMVQGKVEVALAGSDNWSAGKPNQLLHPGDRVRTG